MSVQTSYPSFFSEEAAGDVGEFAHVWDLKKSDNAEARAKELKAKLLPYFAFGPTSVELAAAAGHVLRYEGGRPLQYTAGIMWVLKGDEAARNRVMATVTEFAAIMANVITFRPQKGQVRVQQALQEIGRKALSIQRYYRPDDGVARALSAISIYPPKNASLNIGSMASQAYGRLLTKVCRAIAGGAPYVTVETRAKLIEQGKPIQFSSDALLPLAPKAATSDQSLLAYLNDKWPAWRALALKLPFKYRTLGVASVIPTGLEDNYVAFANLVYGTTANEMEWSGTKKVLKKNPPSVDDMQKKEEMTRMIMREGQAIIAGADTTLLGRITTFLLTGSSIATGDKRSMGIDEAEVEAHAASETSRDKRKEGRGGAGSSSAMGLGGGDESDDEGDAEVREDLEALWPKYIEQVVNKGRKPGGRAYTAGLSAGLFTEGSGGELKWRNHTWAKVNVNEAKKKAASLLVEHALAQKWITA